MTFFKNWKMVKLISLIAGLANAYDLPLILVEVGDMAVAVLYEGVKFKISLIRYQESEGIWFDGKFEVVCTQYDDDWGKYMETPVSYRLAKDLESAFEGNFSCCMLEFENKFQEKAKEKE